MTTVGVLGGGQLGQMLTLAGYPLGIYATCFDESRGTSASLVGTTNVAQWGDIDAVDSWASACGVITYEWENVPVELAAHLSEAHPVHPSPRALAIAQDRIAEKSTFLELDIPTLPNRAVTNEDELIAAVRDLELPVIAKIRTGGYDGRGQVVIHSESDTAPALALLERWDLEVEPFVEFTRELSVIGVRDVNGDTASYPLVQNEHRSGILHATTAPAPAAEHLDDDASDYIRRLMAHMDYVGVLALEFFETEGRLVANEIAPRVHNSGHWTIEGAETSQFENHMRAVSGLPLGSTEVRCPSVMINLIGTESAREDILAVPGAHLHHYGRSPRPGRKLGHVTVTGPTAEVVQERRRQIEDIVDNVLA